MDAPALAQSLTSNAPTTNETKQVRPEVPQDVQQRVSDWIAQTDNLQQRDNALWEAREANKALFPARFNADDPRRGQTPMELQSGKDKRRVQTPYIFRDGLQITAMSVPEDMTFRWTEDEQVEAPMVANPMALQGQPPMGDPATGQPIAPPPPVLPTAASPNPEMQGFARTLEIVERKLLTEARWIEKVQAFVQDSGYFPSAFLKFYFRREYQTTPTAPTPPNRDQTDQMGRLEGLMRDFASGAFDKNSAQSAEIKDLLKSLAGKAAISRWFGIELQNCGFDSVGISEESQDLVSNYDAPFWFHDVLMTGQAILGRYPYKEGDDGETLGILPDELIGAAAWDNRNASTDPNARNRVSRNKQLTTPRSTPVNTTTTTGSSSIDPKKQKYVVREIYDLRTRTVYTVIRGVKHFLDKYVPQKTCSRWYPFIQLAPNRVPGECYAASDLELKRDIQARIHRKATDCEKARWLAIDRYVYDTGVLDEKVAVKLGDIPPGQFRGIPMNGKVSLKEAIVPLAHKFDPLHYDTTKDERDKDMMGALPVQALGTTGVANFATEANMAAQGAGIATAFRQGIIRRCLNDLLVSIAEILLQELSREEVMRIAGPFAVWPEIYSDEEAAAIVADAKQRAEAQVQPLVLRAAVQDLQQGIPIDPQAIQAALDAQAAPIWQQEMISKYGNIEPMSRESMFRRLKVKVSSSLSSSLDRQNRIQSASMLAKAIADTSEAALSTATPFNARPMFRAMAQLMGDETDEMFPAQPTTQMIAQMTQQAAIQATAQPQNGAPGEGKADGPEKQAQEGGKAPPQSGSQGTQNAQASLPGAPVMPT